MPEPRPTLPRARAPLRWALDLFGALLLAVAARKLAYDVWTPLAPYDDGILLTDSMLVGMGKVPYRDFASNYGPGLFATLGLIFKLAGPSAAAARALGGVIQVALAAMAGLLAGRITGRRFSMLAAGLVALWHSLVPPSPYPWLAALALALAAMVTLSKLTPTSWRWSGLLLGMTSWFRPDLAILLVPSLAVAAALALALARPHVRERRAELAAAARAWLAGAALTLAMWAALFALSGTRPIHDVFIDQARYVVPERHAPWPTLAGFVRAEGLPLPVPAVLADTSPAAVVLALSAPLLAAALAAAGTRRGIAPLAAIAAGALSAAVLPQILRFPDDAHCLLAAAPALVVYAAGAEALAISSAVGAGAAALLAACLFFPARILQPISTRGAAIGGPTRYGGVQEPDTALLEATAFVQRATRPQEPIFVGLTDHRRTTLNHMLFYFLAGRPGATRHMQFDPGLTDRADVQTEMARELEAQSVRWIVLTAAPDPPTTGGTSILDAYLATHYRPYADFGRRYLLLQRVPH